MRTGSDGLLVEAELTHMHALYFAALRIVIGLQPFAAIF